MENIPVFIHYNGEWNQSMDYINFDVTGMVLPDECDYISLLQKLNNQLESNQRATEIEVKYQVKNEYPPLKIQDNVTLFFYKELKKQDGDCTKYPLCISFAKSQRDVNFFDSTLLLTNTQIRSIHTAAASSSKTTSEMMSFNGEADGSISEAVLCANYSSNDFDGEDEEIESKFDDANVISNRKHPEIDQGQIYKDKETLSTVMSFYAIKNHFQYKVKKSCRRQFFLDCWDERCDWKLRASRKRNTSMFMIRKLNNVHICPLESRTSNQRQATSAIIGECIKSKFLSLKTVYTPGDILRDMKEDYGVNINYTKAYRSKEMALEKIRGRADDSFGKLPSYLYLLQIANPGSFMRLQTTEDNNFLYVFMALDASIKGWTSCMPLVAVDGTFLKSAYGGTLLSASTQDGNGKIFPLAFSVADSENNESWEWFIQNLREAFGLREGMCIISDRHESIKNAIGKVYPEVSHGICTFHLYNNLKTNFRKKSKDFRKTFFKAARAYTKDKFEFYMAEIDEMDARIRPYLEKVGYPKWARAHITNNRHLMMTTNVAESLNAKIRGARELPITPLLEYLRALVQEWTYTNRFSAMSTFTSVSKRAENMLHENYIDSLKMKVSKSTDQLSTVYEHDLIFTVDLKEKTCTCRRFQMDKLPCPHAMALLKELHQEPYRYCSEYFGKEMMLKTYEGIVYPVDNQNLPSIPTNVTEKIVLPPHGKTKSGRPKKRRIKGPCESTNQNKCSSFMVAHEQLFGSSIN
ncbi:uncharacterized protein LOC130015536 [Mercurialis annua]|uniref:uncharacterized protein LOC130015536 n=1 Tax=Mercurialis annua TaxID=3986 RepID=UPI0024ADF23D|nr:uncharacterized protein LOC130015536 [Mercurialis annua]